jgi:hypothetical protein
LCSQQIFARNLFAVREVIVFASRAGNYVMRLTLPALPGLFLSVVYFFPDQKWV